MVTHRTGITRTRSPRHRSSSIEVTIRRHRQSLCCDTRIRPVSLSAPSTPPGSSGGAFDIIPLHSLRASRSETHSLAMGRQEMSETRMTSPVYWQEDGKSALATHPDLGPAIPPAVYVTSHKSLVTDQLLPLDGRNDFPQDVSTTAQCYPQQRWTAERPGPSDRDAALRDLSGAEQDSVRTLATTSSGEARKGDRARGGSRAEHASLMSAGNHRQVISIVHKESVHDEPGDGHGGDDPSALSLIVSLSCITVVVLMTRDIWLTLNRSAIPSSSLSSPSLRPSTPSSGSWWQFSPTLSVSAHPIQSSEIQLSTTSCALFYHRRFTFTSESLESVTHFSSIIIIIRTQHEHKHLPPPTTSPRLLQWIVPPSAIQAADSSSSSSSPLCSLSHSSSASGSRLSSGSSPWFWATRTALDAKTMTVVRRCLESASGGAAG